MGYKHSDAIRHSNLYELKGLAKPVLCTIASLIIEPEKDGKESMWAPDQIGWCIASHAYIAASIGCNPEHIGDLAAMFVEDGWLTSKKFHDDKGHWHIFYTITDDQLKAIIAHEMKKDEHGDFIRLKNPKMSRKSNTKSQANMNSPVDQESTGRKTTSLETNRLIGGCPIDKESTYKTLNSIPSSNLGEEKSKPKSTDKSKEGDELRSPKRRTEGNQDKATATEAQSPSCQPLENPPVPLAPLYPLKPILVEDFLKVGCPQEALDNVQRWKLVVLALNNNEINPFKAYASMATGKSFGKLWMPHYLLTVSE
jgi:hypothetical protein